MFLRSKRRFQDGKAQRYFSVVENRRVRAGRVVQRQVLFLGEINDRPQGAWRKTLEVFDEAEQRAATLSLFPEDREIPADAHLNGSARSQCVHREAAEKQAVFPSPRRLSSAQSLLLSTSSSLQD